MISFILCSFVTCIETIIRVYFDFLERVFTINAVFKDVLFNVFGEFEDLFGSWTGFASLEVIPHTRFVRCLVSTSRTLIRGKAKLG